MGLRAYLALTVAVGSTPAATVLLALCAAGYGCQVLTTTTYLLARHDWLKMPGPQRFSTSILKELAAISREVVDEIDEVAKAMRQAHQPVTFSA